MSMCSLCIQVVATALFVCRVIGCLDKPPSNEHTCAEQHSWGKCNASWMIGSCCSTCFSCAPGCGSAPNPPAVPIPCDPSASPEVKAALQIIRDAQASGKILTGQVESDQHDDTVNGSRTFLRRDWDTVHAITGKYPAIWGSQFLWGTPSWTSPYREAMVGWADELWQDRNKTGRVLTQMNFHLCPPTPKFRDRSCQWDDIEGKQWPASLGAAILTQGTEENKIWVDELDRMAWYLKQLQNRSVPVLWRPFHEANGGWFWWGKQPQFKQLWQQMFDRFTQHHQLHNLIWVYGPSAQFPISPMYPGGDQVDILGQDRYASKPDTSSPDGFTTNQYEDLVTTANGKLIALTEVGLAPGDQVLLSQNHAYFLMWGGFEKSHNNPTDLRVLYQSPRTINRGEF